ncbi:MAG: hypothetical protein A2Y33_06230 [Spirochaetes bacterium GWF1_51_8]|nr:MAG: hypothetical protein A2Y33_06230 [Spirochaetes bacterium GWF1_51_8]
MEEKDTVLFRLLSFFVPRLREFRFIDAIPSSQFDFNLAGEVQLESVIWTCREYESVSKNFIFLCAPFGVWKKEPVFGGDETKKLAEQIFFSFLPSQAGSNIGFENAGTRYISNPGAEWRTDKVMFTLRENPSGRPVYLLVPWQTIRFLMKLAGLEYIADSDSRLIVTEPSYNDPVNKIASIENSILCSKEDFFYPFQNLLLREDLADNEGKAMLANLLAKMLQNGYIALPHLAVFVNERAEFGILRGLLSAKNAAVLDQYAVAVNIGLPDAYGRYRWRNQALFQLRQGFSRVLRDDPKMYELLPENGVFVKELASRFRELRYREKEKLLPLGGMIARIIASRQVNPLIGGDGKERLVTLAAFHGDDFLTELYGMFKPVFQEEFHAAIGKARGRIKAMPRHERERMEIENSFALHELLEGELVKRTDPRKSTLDMRGLADAIGELDSRGMTRLFYLFGFERFVNFFDIFLYHPMSQMKEGEARKFFIRAVSKLPFTERTIAEDIFGEEMNRSRMLGIGYIEKAYPRLRGEFAVYQSLGFIPGGVL